MSSNGLTDFIEQLSDENRNCRLVGHTWPFLGGQYVTVDDTHVTWRYVDMDCLICGTERHDILDNRNGNLIHRRYHYAPGYRKPHGLKGRVSLSDVRAEFLRRVG